MSMLAVIGMEAEVVTVTRRATGSRVKGVMTPGSSSTFDTVASVQPMSARQAQMQPEGIRQRSPVVLCGGDELKATDPATGAVGDTFSWHGRTYEVTGVEDWTVHGGFYKSIAAKVEV